MKSRNASLFDVSMTLLVALALSGCDAEDNGQGAASDYHHLVRTVTVATLDEFHIEREFAGLVIPRQSTDIGFELSGQVVRILVDEGASVLAGQLLAELDQQLLVDEADQLQARRSEIESQVVLNQANRQRFGKLQRKGFAAEQRIDELSAEQGALAASLAQLDAGLNANQTRQRKSRLLAPFDGSVSRRYIDEGAVLAAGAPLLQLLEDDRLEARIGLPVRLLDELEPGQSVTIELAGQTVTGLVLAIGAQVTRATLTVPARIALPAGIRAVSGAQAYLTLKETVETPGVWLPLTALTEGLRGLWKVYVLTPVADSALYRIETRDVQITYANAHDAFVSGALADGEQVVATGLQRLVPGQIVRLEAQTVARR